MRSENSYVLWTDSRKERAKSFVVYIQMFPDKAGTSLKALSWSYPLCV